MIEYQIENNYTLYTLSNLEIIEILMLILPISIIAHIPCSYYNHIAYISISIATLINSQISISPINYLSSLLILYHSIMYLHLYQIIYLIYALS
jgi:hypothetical protein